MCTLAKLWTINFVHVNTYTVHVHVHVHCTCVIECVYDLTLILLFVILD